jgi:serine/threonine protein kinase
MTAYNEVEQRVLIYLERKLHERRGAQTKAKQGVEKIEIMADCSLAAIEYSRVIGRLETDGLVTTVARNAKGEFVNSSDSVIELVRNFGATPTAVVDSNFTLDVFVNSGLYGTVWKATQIKPARTVAVKIVNPEHGMSFNAAEHAQGLVKAGPHPNIVDVYQVTTVLHPDTNKLVEAVVMEWLEGTSVGHRLGESTMLGPEETKVICSDIINGMSHLHSKNVTHSDLHVGNVILTPLGARIIDIDYSSANSLARLTTLAREHAIQVDVAQTAHVVGLLIMKTAINQQFFNDNEERLRCATSLKEVGAFLTDVFSQPQQTLMVKSTSSPPPATASLAGDVEAAIENRRKVTLRRLVMTAANSIATELASDQYPASGQTSKELLRERMANYKAAVRPFLSTLGVLGYWGGSVPNSLTVEAIDRLANAHERNPLESGVVAYLSLRRYPVVSSLYAAGVGAVAGSNYRGLLHILRDTVFYEHGKTKRRLWTELAYWSAENRNMWNSILGRDMYFPVSQVLEDDLRDALAETIPSDVRYVEAFDRFEFFASLDHFLFNGRALGVSFLWRRQKEKSDTGLISEIRGEAEAEGASWPPLKAGLMKGIKQTNVLQALDEFRESVQEAKNAYNVW